MRKYLTLAVGALALGLAACSQDATDPNAEPQFSKGGGGSPHYITDETGCTQALDGSLTCYYKIAGLANNATVVTTLSINVDVTYNCINPGGQAPPPWQNRTLSGTASATQVAEKSGMVRGELSINFTDSLLALQGDCPNDNWTYELIGLSTSNSSGSAFTLTSTVNGGTVLNYTPQL